MKKFSILFLVGVLIIPNLTFAAWWNPFSWFKSAPQVISTPKPQESHFVFGPYRFYVTDNANVRACQGVGCVVVRQISKGSYFDFPGESNYTSSSSLPEWVSVSWKDGNSLRSGFINKALLSENPPLTPTVTKNKSTPRAVETSAQLQQDDRSVAQLNQLLDEVQQKYESVKDLPTCGGKTWYQCPAGTTFYCAADGVAHCSAPPVTTSYSNDSVASQMVQIMQDTQKQIQQHQQELNAQDATTTRLKLIDYFVQNNSFKDGWDSDQTCSAAYANRTSDINRTMKILIQYCMRPSSTVLPSSLPTREVCAGAQYDPYTSTLLLQSCKEW